MSFWKRWFGGSASDSGTEAKAGPPETYNGFMIRAAPFRSGAQFQAAGYIEKDIAGVRKQHHFIRADFFTSQEDAEKFSLAKARQIIDLQGERLFDLPG